MKLKESLFKIVVVLVFVGFTLLLGYAIHEFSNFVITILGMSNDPEFHQFLLEWILIVLIGLVAFWYEVKIDYGTKYYNTNISLLVRIIMYSAIIGAIAFLIAIYFNMK